MTINAPDIRDLEKMLNDGEGDASLSRRAIEIIERLDDERRRARYKMDYRTCERLAEEDADFKRVIGEILRRRHDHVLDRFFGHIERNKYDWDGPLPPWKTANAYADGAASSHLPPRSDNHEGDTWDNWAPIKEFY